MEGNEKTGRMALTDDQVAEITGGTKMGNVVYTPDQIAILSKQGFQFDSVGHMIKSLIRSIS